MTKTDVTGLTQLGSAHRSADLAGRGLAGEGAGRAFGHTIRCSVHRTGIYVDLPDDRVSPISPIS